MFYRAAIIGGGMAGLQAALTLARGRHEIVLIDTGEPRHRFAATMHNFVGLDGANPEIFYEAARVQLAGYPNVTFLRDEAVHAESLGLYHYRLGTKGGATIEAQTVLFACGMKDMLPTIPGLADYWGQEVQHCSYCHGYEARDKALVLRSTPENLMAFVEQFAHLSRNLRVVVFNGEPDAPSRDKLKRLGIAWETQPLRRIRRDNGGLRLEFADGKHWDCDVLYIQPGLVARSPLPAALGCSMEGPFMKADAWGQTNVTGLYVAGDLAYGQPQQLVAAAKSGFDAGVSIHLALAASLLQARLA